MRKALQLFENNQPEQAIQLIDGYLPQASVEERIEIAELYIQWGFLNEAITILTNLMNEYPNDGELKVMLADIYIENDQDEQALLLLNEISEHDDAYLQALVQQADLYQAQGLFEVAEQKLLSAKRIAPEEEIIDFALGELFFSMGQFQKAVTHYQKVKSPDIAGVGIADRLAEAFASTGEYEQALDYYQKLTSDDPDTLFKHGFTAAQIGRHDIAINTWEKVIEKDPYYHSVYYELAGVYEKEELIKEAYETALKGIEVDEFNKKLYFLAGKLAHQLHKNEKSNEWISEAISLDPDYKEAILFKIELLKENENHEEIIQFIHYIQEEGGDDPLYDWELARAYNENESYKEALNHYQQAYNNLSTDSDFLKEYGYFLIEEGRTTEAINILDRYLNMNPEDFEIEELLRRFK